jgi:TetR/AcrR family transcriptional repressor of nem operon
MKRKIYREDIIEAGRDLMFLRGYNDTGIKDITEKIDIPKGSFYNHFSSKEEFGLEVVREYMRNGLEIHKKNFLDKTKSPKQRIQDFYNGNIEWYRDDANFKLGCMMSNFSAEMADINNQFQNLLAKGFAEQEGTIRECIAEGQESGEISTDVPAELMAASIINGWHGALVRMKAEANMKPLEDFQKFFLNRL